MRQSCRGLKTTKICAPASTAADTLDHHVEILLLRDAALRIVPGEPVQMTNLRGRRDQPRSHVRARHRARVRRQRHAGAHPGRPDHGRRGTEDPLRRAFVRHVPQAQGAGGALAGVDQGEDDEEESERRCQGRSLFGVAR